MAVKKGTQLYIEGRLRTRSWTDKNGGTRYTTEINVDNLQLLGRRDSQGEGGYQQGGYQHGGYQQNGGGYQQNGYQQGGYQQNSYQKPYQPPVEPAQPAAAADDPADDLPF